MAYQSRINVPDVIFLADFIIFDMTPIDSEEGEIIRVVASVCPPVGLSIRVCETYVVHHFVSTGLCCAPLTSVVHHRAALCTWNGNKGYAWEEKC